MQNAEKYQFPKLTIMLLGYVLREKGISVVAQQLRQSEECMHQNMWLN